MTNNNNLTLEQFKQLVSTNDTFAAQAFKCLSVEALKSTSVEAPQCSSVIDGTKEPQWSIPRAHACNVLRELETTVGENVLSNIIDGNITTAQDAVALINGLVPHTGTYKGAKEFLNEL